MVWAYVQVGELSGQWGTQLARFGVAFVLSAAIGLEREIRQQAAGLRTYTVVGIGAALFTFVSMYGFADVLEPGRVVLDPSRVAAQIVSGLGFIGAGVIFVQRGSVKGLTSAATIWMTAAVGAASAAGLPLLAVLTTVAYFAVAYLIRPLSRRLPGLSGRTHHFRITYSEGHGTLRELVNRCTEAGFSIIDLSTLTISPEPATVSRRHPLQVTRDDREEITLGPREAVDGRTVQVAIGVLGRGDSGALAAQLASVPGVLASTMISGDED
ncbi:MgtC/SapB family protein [Acrocarpospora catenulata]|uniref:MgtC/SapB family protein n=1 Tax=Acrocarpospora catenulata TaxID=2836182 RepID=UPI001BDB536E|nr:MgtC/SapB family protein [Acrocarpospora catenulata]